MGEALIKRSRFLCLVLRHKPGAIGLTLDDRGWAPVDELLRRINDSGRRLSRADLEHIVATDGKRRYSFNSDGSQIRATYGHSISVTMEAAPCRPPSVLFHGTATRSLRSIRSRGIVPGRRQYVHLSADPEAAARVGQRHGEPVVLHIAARAMHDSGLSFFDTGSGIWLTLRVPPQFIEVPHGAGDS